MAKPAGYWNDKQRCAEAASECGGRHDFRLRFGGAYKAAASNEWLDDFFPSNPSRKITPAEYDQRLLEDGRGIVALEPYIGAHTKILHQCSQGHEPWSVTPRAIKGGRGCPHCDAEMRGAKPRGYWTLEQCMKDARRFNTRNDWRLVPNSGYRIAQKNVWLNQCCAHMEPQVKPNGYWTLERCMEDAAPYDTVSDWRRGTSGSGYRTAHGNGWLDQCCAHMERAGGSDCDSVYGWKVTSASDDVVKPMPGYHLVKFGVTSQKRGDSRLKQVAKSNHMEQEVLFHCDTSDGDARAFESILFELGTDAGVPCSYDGYSEMRLISDAEMGFLNELFGFEEVASTQALAA